MHAEPVQFRQDVTHNRSERWRACGLEGVDGGWHLGAHDVATARTSTRWPEHEKRQTPRCVRR
jgi:hypothetical protein